MPNVLRRFRFLALAVVLTAASSCSSTDSTGPTFNDLGAARRTWLANHPLDYTFELSTTGSWVPQSPYYTVQVVNGQTTAMIDPFRGATTYLPPTIDDIWNGLLAAQGKGQLHLAQFSVRGVPLETDFGPWEVDGGVHYSVRNFRSTR